MARFFVVLFLAVSCGGAFLGCGDMDGTECALNDRTICREGVNYWVDSCGNEGNKAGDCDCGCNADSSGCKDPCDCAPDCDGKQCGNDGCEGTCGACEGSTEYCTDDGACVDDCEGRQCGPSPIAGHDCGDCPGATDWCTAEGQCEDDCLGRQCGPSPNGGFDCGSCQPPQECVPDGTCQDPTGPRIIQCDTQDAYAGWPLGIHCYGEDAQGGWLEEYELVSSSLDGAFLEGNAILTNRPLTPDDMGPYSFEVVGRDAQGTASPAYPVDILVDRYHVSAIVRHDSGTTGLNFPNALYEILGSECAFAQYTPLDQLGLVPGGPSVSVEVLDESEPDAVACMTDLLAALPVDRPDVWLYARHYGTEPVTDHLWRVIGYTFRVSDEFVGR